MSYLNSISNFFYTATPQMNVTYEQVVGIITDRAKASRVATLLGYLFTNTITSINTLPTHDSISVELQHTNTNYRKLPGYNTLLYVPSKVKFTVYKDGRIQFKDPNMAPYERVDVMSYYVWHHVDILDNRVHIGASHSVSFYFQITDLGNISTEIPYSTILDALYI